MMNVRRCNVAPAFFAVLGVWCVLIAPAMAQQPVDHSVFQKMVGEWKAEGELTMPNVDQPILITEEWKGEFDDEGRLVINGTRKLGDNEQTYSWIYYYNSSLEFHEVTYKDSNSEEEKTFQVSANEDESWIELQIPLGDSGATLNLRSAVRQGNIESVATVVDSGGGDVGGGKIVHTRAEEADAAK
jgi:hypothetical protein